MYGSWTEYVVCGQNNLRYIKLFYDVYPWGLELIWFGVNGTDWTLHEQIRTCKNKEIGLRLSSSHTEKQI